MSDDYITRTLQAYELGVDRYRTSTADAINTIEIDQLLACVPASGRILDAGCAFGRDTRVIADRGLDVSGIDLSPKFIEHARSLYPDLSFEVMDVRSLRFPDSYFAGIYCNAVLLHLKDEDIAIALKEFYRVLEPGGVVALSFKEGTGSEEKVETFSSDSVRFFNYQTVASAEALVRAAGFEVVESHTLNERERFGPQYRDLNWVWVFGRKP